MTAPATDSPPSRRDTTALLLATLGIVYGDIGTSPLYALRECFSGSHPIPATPENVLGVLSLIFWALFIVISVKYVVFVMRADNRGEGGILSLTALVTPVRATAASRRLPLVLLGLFGAALLYGDGMITPAISVLSAVEGLEVATPLFTPYVIPITLVILVGLFLMQSRGTAGVGALFGPVMMVWFLVLAGLGLFHVFDEPGVIAAVNPLHAVTFFQHNGWWGFMVLGSVFLVVTGGEALYVDMGHFGKRPIRRTWFGVVLPALLLNYFGQGAYLLDNPSAVVNPFYRMVPGWALYPFVVLATMATVIASQAVISGAFSLTRQAIQLGYIPRLDIEHTSEREIGQIYIPSVNWLLMLCCLGLVLGFRSSTNLAAAYGVAVTTDMVFTALLFSVVARKRWKWSPTTVIPLVGLFLVVDLSFWGANILKIPHGGWFPLLVGAVIFTLMSTWKKGRQILASRLKKGVLPLDLFIREMKEKELSRVPGTAVFMYSDPRGTPPALLHAIKHFKVLHERVAFLAVETEEEPHVPDGERVRVEELGKGFYRVVLRYGFMEEPDVLEALGRTRLDGADLKPLETTYVLGRETLISAERPGMARWREHLFAVMSRNARTATSFFGLPPNRVVELGMQIEI
jgi:KUP system potassium uptake protein